MLTNTNSWNIKSDTAILADIGKFVRHQRLKQNITQSQLAETAGINRTTLRDFEKGKRSTTLTLIQILRALNLTHIFEAFEILYEQSPIQLAKVEEASRQRAYSPRSKKNKDKPLSDW